MRDRKEQGTSGSVKTVRKHMLSFFLLIGISCLSAFDMFAQTTFTFNGGGDATSWSDPANWSKSGASTSNYPGENSGQDDQVLIPNGSGFYVTLDVNVTTNSVTLVTVNGDAILDIAANSLTSTGSTADVTGDGDIEISTGTLTVGGTLNVALFNCSGAATINLDGDWDVASFTPSTSTVYFTKSSGTQEIFSTTSFYNIQKTGAGTLTSSVDFDVNSKFTLTSGTVTISGSTTTCSFYGSGTVFERNGGGDFSTSSDGRFYFDDNATILTDASINIPGLKFTRAAAKTLTLQGSSDVFTVHGNVERGGNHSITFSSASMVYAANLTLIYSLTTASNIGSEWVTPTANGPTNVTFSSSNTAIVTLASTRTIPSGGVLSLQQASGNFRITGGSAVLTINGTLQRKTTGSVSVQTVSSGTIVYNSGSSLEYSPVTPANVTVGSEWTSTLTPENVTVNNAGFTVTLPNANMAVTNDLDIAAGILASGNSANTLSIGGNVSVGTLTSTGSFTVGTMVMTGNQAQDIVGGGGASTIANLRINKTNPTDVVTFQSGILKINSGGLFDIQQGTFVLTNLANNLDVSSATFRIQSNGTYKTGGKSVTITSATLDFQSGSTYEFNGTSTTESFITSGATTNYGNVIINNTNATPSVTVPAGKLIVIQNDLTMTNGLILSGATNSSGDIEVDGTASSSSATSYVNGTLRVKFPSGAASRDFPIGYSSNYRPAIFGYTTNTVATSIIEIEALSGDPGGTAPSGIAQIATSHYYTVKEVGTPDASIVYDLTLTYTGTGLVPDSRNKILIQNGATPDYFFPTQGTAVGGIQTVSGLTALPTNAFKVAFGAGGAIKRWQGTSGNWSVASNWENSALPLNGDEILLDNSLQASTYTVTYNTATTATTFAKITIDATAGAALQLDKATTIDLTDGTTGLDISNNANSQLIYNGTSIGMSGGGYDAAKTSIGVASTVEFRTGTVYADDYGNLTVNTAGTLSSTGTTTVAGNYTKSGSGSHDIANTSLSVTGTSDIQAGTFSSSGTGSLSLGAVTNSATITVSGSGASSLGAVANSSTMTINSTAGTVTFTGNYSGNGTLSATSSTPTVTFQADFSPGGSVTFGSQTLQFQGNITVLGGTLTLSSGSSFIGASKDFQINGGSVASSSGTITFQTGASQTITGNVTFPSLTMNNANNVTITSGSLITVTGTLTLTDGLVNFANNADYITLNSASSVSGGSSSSYVNGKVRKIYATGSNVSGVFPVGKPTGRFQPVTISVGTVTGANQHITVEQIETNIIPPLTTGINLPLVAVSRIRYWNVAYTANGGSMTNPTIRLSWDNNGATGVADGIAGFVGTSSSADVVIARQSNGSGNWSNLGQSAFSGTYANGPNTNTGTVTSAAFTLTDGNADFMTFGALNSDVSLPVELTLFEAAELENVGHVKLTWRTESEIENAYWLVQKKNSNNDFETIATIDGQGSKSSATDYEFVDANVKAGDSVTYRLADVAYNGDIAYHMERALKLKVPERFELLANYPNPFNPTTTISYKLPKQSRVQLTIYNILGQKVRDLVRGELQDAGVQRVFWDSRNNAGSTVSTGVYIYRLQIGNFNTSRKMILMK